MEVSLTTKNRLPYNPETLLLGILCGENHNLKRYTHPDIAALFTIATTQKQPKCPLTDERIDKMWYIYTVEYYSAIKTNEIMPFTTQMDPEIIILNEVN